MSELPSYPELASLAPPALCGLIARRSEQTPAASFEFAWQRDQALVEAIDSALCDAAKGRDAYGGVKPRSLDGLVQREVRAASKAFWSRERFVRIRLLERLVYPGNTTSRRGLLPPTSADRRLSS